MATFADQSVPALIRAALATDDEDNQAYKDVVRALQKRAGDEVFAARLLRQGTDRERTLGVDILAQDHLPDKPLHERAMALLLELAAREDKARVITAVCHAFGHLHDPAAIDVLLRWATHPDENVRFGVVHGLSRYDDQRAIATLIQLSSDEDSDVRDWATFGLGTQIDVDTPAIRAALRARLDDPDADTRMEALAGLA